MAARAFIARFAFRAPLLAFRPPHDAFTFRAPLALCVPRRPFVAFAGRPGPAPPPTQYVVPRRCPWVFTFLAAISFFIGSRIVPTSLLSARRDLLTALTWVRFYVREQLVLHRVHVAGGASAAIAWRGDGPSKP